MFFSPTTSTLRRDPCAAFTLLELLAVLAIVAVLTSLVIGVGRRASESSRLARAKSELAALAVALESYRREHGDFPRTTDGAVLVQSLIGRLDPAGGVLPVAGRPQLEVAKFTVTLDPFADSSAALLDPWGQPYRYAYASRSSGWQSHEYLLVSAGPDEQLTLPLPASGFITSAYESETDREQRLVNADNLYANRSR